MKPGSKCRFKTAEATDPGYGASFF